MNTNVPQESSANESLHQVYGIMHLLEYVLFVCVCVCLVPGENKESLRIIIMKKNLTYDHSLKHQ